MGPSQVRPFYVLRLLRLTPQRVFLSTFRRIAPLQASFRPRGAGGRRHGMYARMDTIPGST